MRQRVIVISLCFLLGVITSVIVAWWFVLFDGSVASSDEKLGEFQVNGWYGEATMRSGVVTVQAWNATDVRLRPTPQHWIEPPWWVDLDEPPEESFEIDALATGWPWPSLHYARELGEDGVDDHGVVVGTNPLTDLSENWVEVDRLPIAPVWSGALGDALVLGAAWYVIAFIGLPWRWQRIRRRKKLNLCQYCGYDQRSSVSQECCSECGRDPQDRGPLFRSMSISVMAMLIVVLCAAVIVFGFKYAGTKPWSVIHYAAYYGDVETVKRELARGVNVETIETLAPFYGLDIRCTPLAAAVAGGEAETVQVLIDAGADVNVSLDTFGTPLAAAMAYEDLDTARRLIDAGADVNALSTGLRPSSALVFAAIEGRITGLELLLENGFDVKLAGQSLEHAATFGHREFIERMLELGAPVKYDAMARAVRWGGPRIVELMLEYGGDPSSRSTRGETLFFWATSEGDGLETCRLLIDAGVDVNAATRDGQTALKDAVEDVELVRFLLDHGADIAAADGDGRTALIDAAELGSVDSMLLLLERGADPEDLRDVWIRRGSRRQDIIDRVLAEFDEKP